MNVPSDLTLMSENELVRHCDIFNLFSFIED